MTDERISELAERHARIWSEDDWEPLSHLFVDAIREAVREERERAERIVEDAIEWDDATSHIRDHLLRRLREGA